MSDWDHWMSDYDHRQRRRDRWMSDWDHWMSEYDHRQCRRRQSVAFWTEFTFKVQPHPQPLSEREGRNTNTASPLTPLRKRG